MDNILDNHNKEVNASPWLNALKYGGIAAGFGVIVSLIVSVLGYTNNQAIGTVIMILSIIVTITVLVLGIKNHRDVHQNGYITLGKAMSVGLAITVVMLIITLVYTIINVYFINPDIFEEQIRVARTQLKEQGFEGAQLEQSMKITEYIANLPATLIMVTCMTVGFNALATLIIGAILQRKPETSVSITI